MDLQEKVRTLIAEHFDIDINQVTLEASFVDDIGADSLETVELVMKFEDVFDIDIPDEDAANINVVKDAIDYLVKKVK